MSYIIAVPNVCPACGARPRRGSHDKTACQTAIRRRLRGEAGRDRGQGVWMTWTAERLRERVSVDGRGCWIWQRSIAPAGYGMACVAGRSHSAHRLSWRIHCGEIPPGFQVCHRCDVRACVNPSHLFLGTPTDNMRDAARKGRTLRGDRNPKRIHSRVTMQIATEIRARRSAGQGGRALAREYGLSDSIVCKIFKNKVWAA